MSRGHGRPSLSSILKRGPSVGELQKEIAALKEKNGKLYAENYKIKKENEILSKENEYLRKPWDELEKALKDAMDERTKKMIRFYENTQTSMRGWD